MKRLLILDSNSIINRAFYGIRTLNAPDGTPTNAIYGFLNILIKLINDHKPDYIVAAFDLKAPTFRHKLYKEYKANRKGMPEELAAQMPVMKDILSDMNIPILQLEGYEADDIIGTVSRICGENKVECYIATGDRDDLQLAGNGTTVVLTATKSGQSVTELYDDQTVFEKYGVSPEAFVDMKALMGDTSDNIPGVKGIGEKTASKLISRYGSIENLYDNINEAEISDKIKSGLTAEKDIAFLSKELAKIDRFVPIEIDFNNAVFTGKSSDYSNELYTLLMRLGLKSIIKKLEIESQNDVNIPTNTDFFADKSTKGFDDTKSFASHIKKLGNKVSVYLEISGNTLVSAAFSDGKTAYYSAPQLTGDALISTVKSFLADNSVKKYVYGIKDAMVALAKHTSVSGIEFDACIAAHIVNPSNSGDLQSAAATYLGVYLNNEENNQLSLFDDIDSDISAKYALIIYALSNTLADTIEKNGQHELYYDIELPLIDVLSDMECTGILVDKNELISFGEMLKLRIEKLEKEIHTLADEEFNINSPKQLGEILFGKLGLKGGKKTKTGFSTKADVLEKLAPNNEIVHLVLEYRTYQKLKSTYCDGLAALVNPVSNRIHSVFHQTGTVTGRLSSSEPNLQNIPTRTELGRELRKMFVAKDGCMLIDADYSQIELRVLAHLANDNTMITAFKNGEDIHSVTASKILGIPVEQLTKEQRGSAKAINFGIVYGMSEYTLAQDLHISFKEAKTYMEEYFDKYSGVRDYLEFLKKNAYENGYMKTLKNRIRYINELKSPQATVRSFGERAAMNTPVQGSAADIIKYAMVRVYNRLKEEYPNAKLILQVHDELIIEVPETDVEPVKQILKTEMENSVKLNVPLVVDIHTGKSWYEAK